MNTKEHAHTIHGIPGRMFARHLDARGLYSAQKWVARKETGPDDYIKVEMRFDDQCRNGHQTFTITGSTNYTGGCIHEKIAEHFPTLAPLIPWHLCSTDGPLHYIENTVYLAGDRDCHGLKKGEFRQHTSRGPHQANGTPGIPCWTLTRPARAECDVYSHEKPAPVTLDWKPDGITGEGKERELAHARSSAIWPEATDAELMQEPDALRAQLAARLPELLSRFREAMTACGFDWKE